MAWFKNGEKQDPPPDDKNKNDQSALLDAFAAKLDERLKPFEERINKVSEWQDNLETSLKSETPPDNNGTELTEAQKIARELNSVRSESTLTRAMLIEQNVLNSIESDWAHLKPELIKIFATTSIQAKSAANYVDMCQNAVSVLIGREARKGGIRRDSHGKFFIEESISSESDRDNPINDLPAWQSDDHGDGRGRVETAADTLRKLKINPDDFAKDYKEGRLN